MAIVEPSVGKAPKIDDGTYPITCVGVNERTVDNDQFGNSEKLEFHMIIEGLTDEDGEPQQLNPLINKKWNEKATLYSYAVAFGLKVDLKTPIDTDDFNGRQATAVIETAEEGKWPRITKLLKRGASAATAAENATAGDTRDILSFTPQGDAVANLPLFWGILYRHGINKKHVEDAYGPFTEIDPEQLPAIADALIAKAEGK
jgi:hypothetical protein